MSKSSIEGIVIDKTRFKENSLIIKVLTSSGELISGIYFERAFKNSLQHLNFYLFNSSVTPGKELFRFSDFHFSDGAIGYDFSPRFSDQYFVVAELCRSLFREEDPGRDIFAFLAVELKYFLGDFNPDFLPLFLVKLITIYGYMPEGPYKGDFFDLREGVFSDDLPLHPDHCRADLIRSLFDFVSGNSSILRISNSKERYDSFQSLLRFLELQKGMKISLKSIEILRDLRD